MENRGQTLDLKFESLVDNFIFYDLLTQFITVYQLIQIQNSSESDKNF